MSTKTKPLSDTQLVILTAAAGRDDGDVLPTPPSLKARGAALKQVLGPLLKAGLISERRASRDDAVWRTNENDVRLTLAITDAGLSAIGVDEREINDTSSDLSVPGNGETNPTKKQAQPSKPDVSGNRRDQSAKSGKLGERERPANKTATITALLQSSDGATLDDLMDATGWQAHSIRGFLSGTLRRKLGYTVTSERHDGVRRYRIPA